MKAIATFLATLQPGLALAIAGTNNAVPSGGDGPISLIGLAVVAGLFWWLAKK